MSFKVNDAAKDMLSLSRDLHPITESIRNAIQSLGNNSVTQLEIEKITRLFQSKNEHVIELACQILVQLYEDDYIQINYVLPIFTNELSQCENQKFRIIFNATTNVLLTELRKKIRSLGGNYSKYQCPYEGNHPFIYLLTEKRSEYVNIFTIVESICCHYETEIRKCSLIFMRPFLIQLFKENFSSDHKLIWNLILNLNKDSSKTAFDICFEILQNARVQEDPQFWLDILRKTIEHFVRVKNVKIVPELLLKFISNLVYILRSNNNPRCYLHFIGNLLQSEKDLFKNIEEPILLSLTQLIAEISPFYMPNLTKIILNLLTKHNNCGSFITCNWILESIIQWIAKPALIQAKTFNDFEAIIEFVQKCHYKTREFDSIDIESISKQLYISDPTLIKLIRFSNLALNLHNDVMKGNCHSLKEFSDRFSKLSVFDFCDFFIGITKSIILSTECSGEVLKTMLKVLKSIKTFCLEQTNSFLMPLLFKLSQEKNPENQLLILQFIPELASKENIPKILTTIRQFEKVPVLEVVCLELYYKLWLGDYRTYSYLFQHLNSLTARRKSEEISIALIRIINKICHEKPSQHGPDLVKLISNLINDFSRTRDGVITCVALDTIRVLCESRTINVISTWQALKSKFKSENRVNVLVELCNFFAIIPLLNSQSVEFENFLNEIMDILWENIFHSEEKEVIVASFEALKQFPFLDLKFIQIPEQFRETIKLPKSHLKDISEEDHINNFPYVPGEYWVQMMQVLRSIALEDASKFLGHLIELEMKSFRGGVFVLPEGRPEPTTIPGVPPKCVLKAILDHLHLKSKTNPGEIDMKTVFILKSISKDFSRPLPPFDWSILNQFYENTVEMRRDCISIAANQTTVSKSASSFISKYLLDLDLTKVNFEEISILLQRLNNLSDKLTPNELEIFLLNMLEFYYKEDIYLTEVMENMNVQKLNKDLQTKVNNFVIRIFKETSLESKNFAKMKSIILQFDKDFIMEATAVSSWSDDESIFRKALIVRLHYILQTQKIILNDFDDLLHVLVENQFDRKFVLERFFQTILILEGSAEMKISFVKDLGKSFRDIENDSKKSIYFELFTMSVFVFSKFRLLCNGVDNSWDKNWPDCLQLIREQHIWDEHINQVIKCLQQGLHSPKFDSEIPIQIFNMLI